MQKLKEIVFIKKNHKPNGLWFFYGFTTAFEGLYMIASK